MKIKIDLTNAGGPTLSASQRTSYSRFLVLIGGCQFSFPLGMFIHWDNHRLNYSLWHYLPTTRLSSVCSSPNSLLPLYGL
jgi:hypothetical protein